MQNETISQCARAPQTPTGRIKRYESTEMKNRQSNAFHSHRENHMGNGSPTLDNKNWKRTCQLPRFFQKTSKNHVWCHVWPTSLHICVRVHHIRVRVFFGRKCFVQKRFGRKWFDGELFVQTFFAQKCFVHKCFGREDCFVRNFLRSCLSKYWHLEKEILKNRPQMLACPHRSFTLSKPSPPCRHSGCSALAWDCAASPPSKLWCPKLSTLSHPWPAGPRTCLSGLRPSLSCHRAAPQGEVSWPCLNHLTFMFEAGVWMHPLRAYVHIRNRGACFNLLLSARVAIICDFAL